MKRGISLSVLKKHERNLTRTLFARQRKEESEEKPLFLVFIFVFLKFLYLFSSYTFGPAEVSYSPIRRSIYDTRISPSRLCRSARPRGLISYSSGRFNHPGAPIIRQTLTQSKPRAPNTQTICISQVSPTVDGNKKRNEIFDTFMNIILSDRLTKSKLSCKNPNCEYPQHEKQDLDLSEIFHLGAIIEGRRQLGNDQE